LLHRVILTFDAGLLTEITANETSKPDSTSISKTEITPTQVTESLDGGDKLIGDRLEEETRRGSREQSQEAGTPQSPSNTPSNHEARVLGEIADDLQNYVECLMDLAPMIQEPLEDTVPLRKASSTESSADRETPQPLPTLGETATAASKPDHPNTADQPLSKSRTASPTKGPSKATKPLDVPEHDREVGQPPARESAPEEPEATDDGESDDLSFEVGTYSLKFSYYNASFSVEG